MRRHHHIVEYKQRTGALMLDVFEHGPEVARGLHGMAANMNAKLRAGPFHLSQR